MIKTVSFMLDVFFHSKNFVLDFACWDRVSSLLLHHITQKRDSKAQIHLLKVYQRELLRTVREIKL